MLRLHVLASGSSGNASIIEDSKTKEGILIDCGISKRDFLTRCDEISYDPRAIKGILVTHDHTDHTKGLGVVARGLNAMDCHPPLYTSVAIRRASEQVEDALKTEGVEFYSMADDRCFSIGDISVKPFKTSHDAVESFGFRFELQCASDGSSGIGKTDSIAFLTDSGIVTEQAYEAMQYVRILALESNHDIGMLNSGPYPYHLKKRISSDKGHLSNKQAAECLDDLLLTLGAGMLESVVAMHISKENNTYDLPRFSYGEVLNKAHHGADVFVGRADSAISIG